MTGHSSISALVQQIEMLRATLPDTVRLIAVTKQVSVDMIRAAYAAGLRDFGESRLQETIAKQAQLQDLPDITWHLIGHLQSNKARQALQHFTWIHSLDSLKLAQRLNTLAAELSLRPQVCLQVKLADDPNKYGWSEPELRQDLQQLSQCHQLDIQGLMTILPLGLTPTEALQVFQQTRQLAQELRQQQWPNMPMQELSMGMSGDYLLAIEAGATMIRLGRILFGERLSTNPASL